MLATAQHDHARAALEAIAVEAYRAHRLTGYQLRELLGIRSRSNASKHDTKAGGDWGDAITGGRRG
jgi:hypothetical protein